MQGNSGYSKHGAMPRGSRLDAPGMLHHVMARGIARHRKWGQACILTSGGRSGRVENDVRLAYSNFQLDEEAALTLSLSQGEREPQAESTHAKENRGKLC